VLDAAGAGHAANARFTGLDSIGLETGTQELSGNVVGPPSG